MSGWLPLGCRDCTCYFNCKCLAQGTWSQPAQQAVEVLGLWPLGSTPSRESHDHSKGGRRAGEGVWGLC